MIDKEEFEMGMLTFMLLTLFEVEASGYEELISSPYSEVETVADALKSAIFHEEFDRGGNSVLHTIRPGIPSIWN